MRKKVSYSLPKAPYCFETYVEGPHPVFKYHHHCHHRFHSYYCQHYHQYHHITISTTLIITSITIVCILG